MKCPKCGYVSYDYLDACRKCGRDLVGFKKEIGLQMLRPGDLDLSLVLSGSATAGSGRDDFNIDANFFGGQLFAQGGAAEADEAEFDISLDDDFPMPQAASPAPGAAGQEEALPEESLLLPELSVEMPETSRPDATFEASSAATELSVEMIDMSDLEEVAEVDSTMSTTMLDRLAPGASTLPPVIELTMADTPGLEQTLAEPVAPGGGSGLAGPVADAVPDDLLDTELELELDALDDGPQGGAVAETELLIDLDALDLQNDDEERDQNSSERS